MTEERWPLGFMLSPAQIVAALLKSTPPETLVRTDNGVPDDARFVRLFVDNFTQDVCVVLEHPSFRARYEPLGVMRWSEGLPLLLAEAPYATAYCGADVGSVIRGESLAGVGA